MCIWYNHTLVSGTLLIFLLFTIYAEIAHVFWMRCNYDNIDLILSCKQNNEVKSWSFFNDKEKTLRPEPLTVY